MTKPLTRSTLDKPSLSKVKGREAATNENTPTDSPRNDRTAAMEV
jgi:hypothetical protein